MSVRWIISQLAENLISFIHPLSGSRCCHRHSEDCFCYPRKLKPLNKSDEREPLRPKVFTQPKYEQNVPKTNTTNNSSDK